LKLVLLPAHIVTLAGDVVTTGDVLTVSVTGFDVTEGVQAPLTMQRY
jgi:hypothetical protein